MANPYDVSGLSEGFARGFSLGLENRRQKSSEQQAAEQAELARRQDERETLSTDSSIKTQALNRGLAVEEARRAAKGFESQEKERGLKIGELEYEASDARRKARADLERAELDTRRAQAAASRASAGASSRLSQKYDLENRKFNQEQADAKMLKDAVSLRGQLPYLIQQAGNIDVQRANRAVQSMFAGGPISPSIQEDALGLVNTVFAPQVKKGINQPVDAQTAIQNRIPVGSTIVDKQISGFKINSKKGTVVFDVQVTARAPDGSLIPYNSVITKNRTSAPDDEVLEIPVQELKDKTDGIQLLGQYIEKAKSAGVTNPQELVQYLDSQIDAAVSSNPRQFIKSGTSPALQDDRPKDEQQFLKDVAKIRNNSYMDPDQKQAAVDQLKQDYGFGAAPVGGLATQPPEEQGVRGVVNGKPAMIYPDGTAEYITE